MKFYKYIIIIILLFSFSLHSHSQSREYYVKATLIGKFANYTEWNTKLINNFEICILGDSPFKGEFERIFNKTGIKNKPVKIQYISDYQTKKDCQILFICSSEKKHLNEIISIYNDGNVLLISDTPGFCEKGVHINFYYKQNETLHFEINMPALAKTNLKTDMQLLSIGKIIN